MADFTQQLRNLTINDESKRRIKKIEFGIHYDNSPPYYDPSDNHTHCWKLGKNIRNLTYEQKPKEKYICNKIHINPNKYYCYLCHQKKKGQFRMILGDGKMCQESLSKSL